MRTRGVKVLLLSGLLLIFIGLLCHGAVWVRVLSPVKEVGPGEFVTHVFSVLNDAGISEVFDLEFKVPDGWGLLGAAPTLSLDAGQEETLFITVTVPPGASTGEYAVTLSAVSQSDPVDQASASIAILVSPVNEVEILPLEGGGATPGEQISYEVTIVNRGNAQDTFQLEAESGHRFPLALSQELLSLAPQERAVVEIRLQVPVGASPGRDLLTISATSILYPGVSDEITVFTTILPPPPEAVGGTLMEELPARLRFSLDQDVFNKELDSNVNFSLSGRVADGYVSSYLRASPIYGPDPLGVDSFSVFYRRSPVTCVIGDTSRKLTDLLSLSCRGGRVEIDAKTYDLIFLAGGSEDETRVGGRLSLGPEEAHAGIAYMERRDETDQSAIWSLIAGSKPFEDWSLRLEGALGKKNLLTSRAFFFNTTIKTTSYFLSTDGFSVGTHFPGSRSDTAGVSLSQRLRYEDLSLGLSLSHVQDNVVHDPLVPTTISDNLGLNLYVTPLEDGPVLTSTVGFTWERGEDLTEKNEVERLLSVALTNSQGEFPYAFSAKLTDQIDQVAETHHRTVTFSEGVGLSIADFELFLKLSQVKTEDYLTGELLTGGTSVSLRFNSRSGLHSARMSLANTEDDFDLSLRLDVRLLEDVHVLFDGTLGWDRADATATTFQWGVTFDYRFELPLPFLLTKGRIEGRVFVDQDGDRSFGSGDRGLSGIVVATRRSEVSTDGTGTFRFPPFSPGTYELELRSLPAEAARPSSVRIDLEAGETVWLDLALAPVVVISGTLFNDTDRDGMFTKGEAGFAQVRVLLTDKEGAVTETYTDLNGQFEFPGVLPGQYTVSVDRVSLPDRFEFTTKEEFTIDARTGILPPILLGGAIKQREVLITFQPPIAEFTYRPERPKAGVSVQFDASDSFDFDGEIVSYEWDFDGDGRTDATGITAQHTFAIAGTYKVTLTVTDDGNNSDAIAIILVVE